MLNINNATWENLTIQDIEIHLSSYNEESFFFEYKSDETSNEKFIKEVSALANTYGGYIFLGINDDKTIGGCSQWTEQKIHSVMHDCITPTPIFDVKKFELLGKIVFVVKIEEGEFPPYITNSGRIFERVSSGSFAIKDSNKLQQIYYKNEKQLNLIEKKLFIDKIDISTAPSNLCGYVDMGFHVSFSSRTKLQNNFYKYNLNKIIDCLKEQKNPYSFSRVGRSFVISIGYVTCSDDRGNNHLINAGVNDFIEIMDDGSVRCRILLYSKATETKGNVNIGDISVVNDLYLDMYKTFFEKELKSSFISAKKYEQLTVLKQFTPKLYGSTLQEYTKKQIEKYGNNLIVSGNRYPRMGFMTIDKKLFDDNHVKFTCKNILNQLFATKYTLLGFVDDI